MKDNPIARLDSQEVGNRIVWELHRFAARHHISDKDLAEVIGWTAQQVFEFWDDGYRGRLDRVVLISGALNLSLNIGSASVNVKTRQKS